MAKRERKVVACSDCGYIHCQAKHDAEHYYRLYKQWYLEARKLEKLKACGPNAPLLCPMHGKAGCACG